MPTNVPETLAGVDWLCKTASVDRVVVLGWSYGGAVTIQTAAKHDKVVGVVTIASQTYRATE